MKKIEIVVLSIVFFVLCAAPSVSCAEDTVHYEVIGGDTLVISGTGETGSIVDFNDKIRNKKEKVKESNIRTLIIKEGITKISTQRMGLSHLERIVFPDSLVEIEDYAFSSNNCLEEIVFGRNLKKVGYSAFARCDNLRQIVLPHSVTEIGSRAFQSCPRLKKIVLPSSLRNWNVNMVKNCPALREVVNNSQLLCKIPWYKKYVTWKVGKKKTRVIPPGKTGKSVGKKIPIQFDLMDGKAVGKLPKSYRFGEEVKLPNCVKREGYVFMGWSSMCWSLSTYDSITKVEPGQKKAKFYATWYKYKVESKKRGTATVTFDSTEAVLIFWDHAVRYSMNKNMKDREIVYCNKRKGKVTIRNLWPGRTYYFQISGKIDGDLPYKKWKAKRKVAICI